MTGTCSAGVRPPCKRRAEWERRDRGPQQALKPWPQVRRHPARSGASPSGARGGETRSPIYLNFGGDRPRSPEPTSSRDAAHPSLLPGWWALERESEPEQRRGPTHAEARRW
ncbi:hypothetical protein NDU88_005502 [Pleurodeles waltl]|uniref:Uncharacterized protein n=1 Tax=Pleurodeles waltl TaxID=8319 RepID=A0AAV7M9I1_PLEWA|nr:hypothetical protein NDU88_005502 [Pleurodeles waltl]